MTTPKCQNRQPQVALVVAMAKNRVIGHSGAMPWRMPGDLKNFRRLTMGQPIIMGRKTFQSIGRALDRRTNIVVTRDPGFMADDVQIAASFDVALALAANDLTADGDAAGRCIMVIGGGEIYRAALPVADTIHLTEIDAEPAGDTWFPELDTKEWVEQRRETLARDPRNQYAAVQITYYKAAARSPAPTAG